MAGRNQAEESQDAWTEQAEIMRDALREYQEKHGMTQNAVGRLAGYDSARISQLMTGWRGDQFRSLFHACYMAGMNPRIEVDV